MPATDLLDLVTEIKTILGTLETEGAGGEASEGVKFKQISGHPTSKFTGLPAAFVYESDDPDSDFDTTDKNLRTYSYKVCLVFGLELPGVSEERAWDTARELYARTLDAFDNSNDLNAKCDILEPVTMPWGFINTNLGLALIGTLTLKCKKSVAAHQTIG